MSLGATFVPEPGDEELIAALDKATKYAHKQGTLLVASAGNGDDEGIGINHDEHRELVTIPAQSKHVIGVSSLAPLGYALGATNFDRLSSFSNIGKSIVDLSGPGGDFMLPDQVPPNCTLAINPGPAPTTTTVTQPCWVFDMVVSSCRGSGVANVCWAAGTSMSSPAVAGVAALIVGKKGRMSPDRLFEELARSSDDLGRRGFDAVYGKGRVNAARAVGAGGRDNDDDDRRGVASR
jgi:subtilisin family serine protease